jgi:hypothetical protein
VTRRVAFFASDATRTIETNTDAKGFALLSIVLSIVEANIVNNGKIKRCAFCSEMRLSGMDLRHAPTDPNQPIILLVKNLTLP